MRGFIIGKATNPMKQEYTISITLSLEDWEEFCAQITNKQAYPAWHIEQGIKDVIHSAKTIFTKEIKSE